MSRIRERLELLAELLEGDTLIHSEMFPADGVCDLVMEKTHYDDKYYPSLAIEEATTPEVAVQHAELIDRITQAAARRTAVSTPTGEPDEEYWRGRMCKEISSDFEVIAGALRVELDDNPTLNAIWLCYRSGRIPVGQLEPIEGKLSHLLKCSAAEADLLVRKAIASRDSGTAAKEDQRQAFIDSLLPILGEPRPNKHLVSLPEGSRLALSPDALRDGDQVPSVWKELLADQEAGRAVKWSRLWGRAGRSFPSILFALENQCRGVAVQLPAEGPAELLYFFVSKGYDDLHLETYTGSPPVEDAGAEKYAAFWNRLPDELQHFYVAVHNGWGSGVCGGPLSLDYVESPGEGFGEHASDPPGDVSFDGSDFLILQQTTPGNNRVCLDTRTLNGDSLHGALWKPGWPADVGLDFWHEMNRWVERGFRRTLLCDRYIQVGNTVQVDKPNSRPDRLEGEIVQVDHNARRVMVRIALAGIEAPFSPADLSFTELAPPCIYREVTD